MRNSTLFKLRNWEHLASFERVSLPDLLKDIGATCHRAYGPELCGCYETPCGTLFRIDYVTANSFQREGYRVSVSHVIDDKGVRVPFAK